MAQQGYPPGPRRKISYLFLLDFYRDPIAFLTKIREDYGDLAHLKVGPVHVFVLNHPDLVKDVLITHAEKFVKSFALRRARSLLGEGLLTSEGEFHRRQRRLAQPGFSYQRVLDYGAIMAEEAEDAGERWRSGEVLDVHKEMMHITLAVISRSLFGTTVEADAAAIEEALTDWIRPFYLNILPLPGFLARRIVPALRRLDRAQKRLDEIVYRIIRSRRGSGENSGNLLSLLLHARNQDGSPAFTDRQLRDHCMTLFLAGYETTAVALTWTWYLLSQHPEVEERLHAELDGVLAGRLPTPADVEQLPYTGMVLQEAMRLYPPVWEISRRAAQPYSIGDTPVARGSVLILCQWVMNRDPRYYPQPEVFDPQRWTPEARAGKPRFSYYPFSAGPRSCIGEGFAQMEAVLVLATLAQRWKLRLVPGQEIVPVPSITLRPKYGMRMQFERRQDAAMQDAYRAAGGARVTS